MNMILASIGVFLVVVILLRIIGKSLICSEMSGADFNSSRDRLT